MKKTFATLNFAIIVISIILLFVYLAVGGLFMKGICSFAFVVLGLVNLINARVRKCEKTFFPFMIFTGLFLCMAGDIILQKSFMVGAVIFALGHICYLAAFCSLNRFEARDSLPCVVIFILSASILTLTPYFDFGSSLMLGICLFYALIISFMLGKILSDFLKSKSLLNLILVIGAALFFFSDIMLVFNVFGGAPRIADVLCLFSYWPGQTLLAFSSYLYAKDKI